MSQSTTLNASISPIVDEPSLSSDLLQLSLNSGACGSFQGQAAMESEILTFMMDHIMVCPVILLISLAVSALY